MLNLNSPFSGKQPKTPSMSSKAKVQFPRKPAYIMSAFFGKEPDNVATMLKIWFLAEMPEGKRTIWMLTANRR